MRWWQRPASLRLAFVVLAAASIAVTLTLIASSGPRRSDVWGGLWAPPDRPIQAIERRSMDQSSTEVMTSLASRRPLWNISSVDDVFSEKPQCEEGVFLLMLVTSAPANFEQREAIRATWAQFPSDSEYQEDVAVRWQTVFLVGRSSSSEVLSILIDNEQRRNNDLLLGDYEDTYRNLTYKVLHGLYYADTHCHPQYVLKTDDDCFVNVRLLVNFLSRYNLRTRQLYAGNVLAQTSVVRNPTSKWYVSRDDYEPDSYPPYSSGTGYILSGDVVSRVVALSAYIRPFPNEDAYIGVLVNELGIPPVLSTRFTLYSVNWQPCNYLYLLVIHHVTAQQQKGLHGTALTAKEACPRQNPITAWS